MPWRPFFAAGGADLEQLGPGAPIARWPERSASCRWLSSCSSIGRLTFAYHPPRSRSFRAEYSAATQPLSSVSAGRRHRWKTHRAAADLRLGPSLPKARGDKSGRTIDVNTLKPMLIFAVLIGVCYGVYTRINHKPSDPPPEAMVNWETTEPNVQMPEGAGGPAIINRPVHWATASWRAAIAGGNAAEEQAAATSRRRRPSHWAPAVPRRMLTARATGRRSPGWRLGTSGRRCRCRAVRRNAGWFGSTGRFVDASPGLRQRLRTAAGLWPGSPAAGLAAKMPALTVKCPPVAIPVASIRPDDPAADSFGARRARRRRR